MLNLFLIFHQFLRVTVTLSHII
uniref:Uncharacterized protein n=1 Tax=Arundo donax TaxID=35708 RepID=A0A0A9HBP4_ARUDO